MPAKVITNDVVNERDEPVTMPEQWGTAEVAKRLGWTRTTVNRYTMADRREKYGFPAPQGYVGISPWWTSTDIEAWIAQRPGRSGVPGELRKPKAAMPESVG